jgi:hypothetical protein
MSGNRAVRAADVDAMTKISAQSRTEDLVDRWAHDAGIAGPDEHVKGRAGLKSSATAWEERNHGTPGHAAKHVGVGLVREIAPELIEHGAKHAGARLATGLALGAIGNVALTSYELYKQGWAEPHRKGDEIRQLQHNDAVNVALARSLAFDPRFGEAEKAGRPGVEKGTTKLVEQLNGKDAALKPILQARADEGFAAAERAFKATASVPPQSRPEAMRQWYKGNGCEDRCRNDVAFGKGAEYFLWCQGARGVSVDAEAMKVHARLVPASVFHRQG